MKLSLLSVAALAAATLSLPWLPCGIPYPMDIMTSLSSNSSLNGNLGAADVFDDTGHNAPARWPRNSKNEVVIRYCYMKPEARAALKALIEQGIQAWYDALGGKASKATGHGVVFQEVVDEHGKPLYCEDRGATTNRYYWNDHVPMETVPIHYLKDQGNAATIGFIKPDTIMPHDSKPKPQMHMHLSDITWLVPSIHELGHVLGLVHEHQRADRDKYLFYDCDNLPEYWDKYQKAKELASPDILSKKSFCDGFFVMLTQGFRGVDYIKGKVLGSGWAVKERSPYDYESVMNYYTDGDGNDKCKQGYLESCALLKWHDPDKHEWHKIEKLQINLKPSKLDAEFVRKTYPWRAPP